MYVGAGSGEQLDDVRESVYSLRTRMCVRESI
jgi:hypothetical protein